MAGSKEKKIALIAYVPVIHKGYLDLFRKYKGKTLFLMGEDFKDIYKSLAKDIRAVDTLLMKNLISSMKIFKDIEILKLSNIKDIPLNYLNIVMPDEDIMRDIYSKYFSDKKIKFENVFLRWDKHKSTENQPINVNQTISVKDFDKRIVKILRKEAKKSSDFWRRIGGAIIRDGKIILIGHNHAVPSELMPYVEGDPRSDFHKGVNVELSTVLHAEAGLIASAAQKGISLEGTDMYVTTFPCPPCAKLIAYSGIKRLYYTDGYGMLDGERILKNRGVKIIFIRAD